MPGITAAADTTWKPLASFAEIQNTLAPQIQYHEAGLEVFGQSIPKDEVGGDVLDLVTGGRDTIACVADVSGHGLRAGVLAGMIKTMIRYGLMLEQPIARLLDDMNRVLPPLKTPNMFATIAALRFDGSGTAEYVSAGHIPLLHYRRRHHDVVRYGMSQFPVGLFENASYATCRIPYEIGDVFALLTDGVVELGADRDAESGLSRISQILGEHSRLRLPDLAALIQAETAIRGHSEDDQTVLLVRVAAEESVRQAEPECRRDLLEELWQKTLDDLAEELAVDEN